MKPLSSCVDRFGIFGKTFFASKIVEMGKNRPELRFFAFGC